MEAARDESRPLVQISAEFPANDGGADEEAAVDIQSTTEHGKHPISRMVFRVVGFSLPLVMGAGLCFLALWVRRRRNHFGHMSYEELLQRAEATPMHRCPWMSSTAVAEQMECQDGTLCYGESCCGYHGGRTKCPLDRPVMCANKWCNGDYCCQKDCSLFGGPRPCHHMQESLSSAYHLHKNGKRCNPSQGFLWEGLDEKCDERCSSVPGCVYFTTYTMGWCQLSNTCSSMSPTGALVVTYAKKDVTRVLFIGNSFTYINDLPHQLVNVAASLGRTVEVENSTIGGCTLYAQRPQEDHRTMELLRRDWDFIVLNDQSMIPAFQSTREKYFYPAINNFAAHKKHAKIVLYLTMAYHDGSSVDACHTHAGSDRCWPLGDLGDVLHRECDKSHFNPIESFACMGYAVARGYLAAVEKSGADLVAPAGLAWQAAHGVREIPASCKAHIDAEYSEPMHLSLVQDGQLPDLALHAKSWGKVDIHPTRVGQYLNALTLFATLFGESPLGAGQPNCLSHCFQDDWTIATPGPVKPPVVHATLRKLQEIAELVVAKCGQACNRRISASDF